MLFAGSLIYVLGEFTTVRGGDAAMSVSADVSALLASWKQYPVQLKKRFDLDGNGEIDLQEWERARRLATRTVEQQHRDIRTLAELNIVRAPANGRMFLISTLPLNKPRQRYQWWSAFHLSVAVAALAPGRGQILWVALTSLAFLALLGAIAARVGGANMWVGASRVTFWGALAMAITAGAGSLLGAAV